MFITVGWCSWVMSHHGVRRAGPTWRLVARWREWNSDLALGRTYEGPKPWCVRAHLPHPHDFLRLYCCLLDLLWLYDSSWTAMKYQPHLVPKCQTVLCVAQVVKALIRGFTGTFLHVQVTSTAVQVAKWFDHVLPNDPPEKGHGAVPTLACWSQLSSHQWGKLRVPDVLNMEINRDILRMFSSSLQVLLSILRWDGGTTWHPICIKPNWCGCICKVHPRFVFFNGMIHD